MANIVYNYPKSSCDCYDCVDNKYADKTGKNDIQTNLSVPNCTIPKMFKCYNAKELWTDIEPIPKSGYTSLNTLENKFSDDFQKIECGNPQSCPKVQYATKDPRLISASHGGQVLTLDRPAFSSTVKLDNVATDKSLNKYGQNYKTYSDITGGYVQYYIDKSQEDPYFTPNFTVPAYSNGVLYVDPMSSVKPQYYRKPVKCNNLLDTEINNFDDSGCLSWMRDSLETREDLMSRQMAVRNQQRWESRWREPTPVYAQKS